MFLQFSFTRILLPPALNLILQAISLKTRNMATNPCCMSLRNGVTMMAILDVIFSVLRLILLIVAVAKYFRETGNHNGDNDEEVAIGTSIVVIFIGIIGLLLSIRLYQGATQGNISYCRLWLIVKIVIFILDVIISIINGAAGRTETENLVLNILLFLYRVYMMFCVYYLIQELKLEQQTLGFQARMESGFPGTVPPGTYGPYPTQPLKPVNIHVATGNGYTYNINQDGDSNPRQERYF